MSAQGSVSGAADRKFGLIETCRWSRQGGYDYRSEHMARLKVSAGALGFVFLRDLVERQLTDFVVDLETSPARVRLVLSRDGSVDLSAASLAGPPTDTYRMALAEPRHQSTDPWLRHKTTMRDRYEHPLAAVAGYADEILFVNERDELCEGARSNLFVRRDGHLLTPHLSCGLLPGTLRAHLLARGVAREAVLRLPDLAAATECYLGNSVRGLVKATPVWR